jgi:hypothetical protein
VADLPSQLPDRPTDDAWSELEHGFFAAAPPDVPEPPPEPMRFDDLDPIGPPPPPWTARLSRVWREAPAAPRMLQAAVRDSYRRGAPAVARAWWWSILVSATALERSINASRPVLKRSIDAATTALKRAVPALRIGARNHRLIAAGAAALIVVMGISAGVVASRGGGRETIASASKPLAGAACPMASEEAPPSPAEPSGYTSAGEPELVEAADTIAPEPMRPPVRHKRKHAKRPARHGVQAKPMKLAKPATSR